MRHYFRLVGLFGSALFFAISPAHSDDLVWVTGRVYSHDGKSPLRGATVLAYDDKNHVIDYAKSDEEGNYALAVPKSALHLNTKGGNGFFRRVAGVVGGAGRVAAMPLKAGIKAAASVAVATDPLTKVGIGAASNLAQGIVDTMSPAEKAKSNLPPRERPGAIVLKAGAPGRADLLAIAHVYWMEEESVRTGGKDQRVITTWLDPIKLVDKSDKSGSITDSRFLQFVEPHVEPSIAKVGDKVTISATLPLPTEPRTPIIVVARHSRTGKIFEMKKQDGEVYTATIDVDKTFPRDDQVFTVLAYAEQDDAPGRNHNTESGLVRAGLFEPAKPFVYNPLLVASRNRAEITLTVVSGKNKK